MTESTIAGPPSPARPRSAFLRTPTAKFFLIALLTLGLTLPLMMVWALTAEREGRRDEVLAGVAGDWGGAQTLVGPMLLVPYTLRPGREGDAPQRATAAFLPEAFETVAEAPAEVRTVSIFEATVYTATLRLGGRFGPADVRVFGDDVLAVDWSRAVLALGVSDVGGIEVATAASGDVALTFEPGLGAGLLDAPGIHAALPAGLTGPGGIGGGFAFSIDLRLKGTDRLAVAPVGRQSEIRMASTWPHPGFRVGSLPSERRIGGDGFTAQWRIPYLARAVPQVFRADPERLSRLELDAVGVALTRPVDHYALVERALKYGFMFVAALLGLVFVLEILSPRRIHAVQYALVGLILVFFFVLLLALAEHVAFAAAYGTAAAATTAVVSSFVAAALASPARGAAALCGVSLVFAVLYMILELEDLALLAGAVTGFAVLTAVLFATRRVDWSGTGAGARG